MTVSPLLALVGAEPRAEDGTPLLAPTNLTLHPGDRLAVLGPNGAGKSSLLLALAGLLPVKPGRREWRGTALAEGEAGLRHLRGQVGLVFQDPGDQILHPQVWGEVSLGPANQGLEGDALEGRVRAALERVDLAERAESPVHQLSHGQKRLLNIASALATEPAVLLLDEPTAGLDPAGTARLEPILAEHANAGGAVVAATHEVDWAFRWADRVLLLCEGATHWLGTAGDLLAAPEGLAAVGLTPPAAARLQQRLAAKGLLPADAPLARDVAELERLLERTYSVG